MADEPAVAPEHSQDQPEPPEPPAPEGTSDEPGLFDERFDPASLPDELRPRYRQMQADYTQKTQSLAEQRQQIEQEQELLNALRSNDPEIQNQALEFLGFEPDDDELDEYEEPDDQLEARLAALEEREQMQAAASEDEAFREQLLDYVDGQFDDLEQSTGRTFTDAEVRAISGLAGAVQDERGLPDVRQAYDLIFSDVLGDEKSRWIESKQAPQPGSGRSGTEAPDLSDEQVRRRVMAEAIDAGTSG